MPEKFSRLTKDSVRKLRLAALTAYDFPTARLLDEAGIDLILVGDSLGMVVLGMEDTTGVTVEMMLHHTKAVRRGVENAILVADLPFQSYQTVEAALATAHDLRRAGADAVKLEGGTSQLQKIRAIADSGIPVIGHIGMLPQQILEEGTYKKKGKTESGAQALMEDAEAIAPFVEAIVIESVVPAVASEITEKIKIPTIGIGAGSGCDGEILVVHDLLGSFPWFCPPFAKPRADLARSTTQAVREFIKEVQI